MAGPRATDTVAEMRSFMDLYQVLELISSTVNGLTVKETPNEPNQVLWS